MKIQSRDTLDCILGQFTNRPYNVGNEYLRSQILFSNNEIKNMTKSIKINQKIKVGGNNPLLFIAGPCVIESESHIITMAEELDKIAKEHNLNFIFKASFDKANRTSIKSYRGPGFEEGLDILGKVKKKFKIPILSDIHIPEQAEPASKVFDIIQIPAFLCRQTDLLVSAAKTGKPVNVKKGQFLSPHDVENIIDKLQSEGCERILITERGTTFGYNNLVVDYRAFPIMQEFGYPVIFDATHSVQLPGGSGHASSGQKQFVSTLAKAAVAAECNGIFLEVHDHPEKALSDGPNMIDLQEFESLIQVLNKLRKAIDISDGNK
jgi:2-dehydro-3-deoxyphosphooctonate aldolase (KDO 8-P synthase)